MNVQGELNDRFLLQNFTVNDPTAGNVERYKRIAAGYAETENAIAVLSDLKERVSYIYYGGMAQTLGICRKGEYHSIGSIWEDEVFRHIVPEYMEKRHFDELKFLHFLRNKSGRRYADYCLASSLRMTGKDGRVYPVLHRVFYVDTQHDGEIRLALCLYNLTDETDTDSSIRNTSTGSVFLLNRQDFSNLISEREKEVLQLIDKGKLSKEISETLFISVHTVNRHRQNILAKLRASNSVEACRIAKQLKLI